MLLVNNELLISILFAAPSTSFLTMMEIKMNHFKGLLHLYLLPITIKISFTYVILSEDIIKTFFLEK